MSRPYCLSALLLAGLLIFQVACSGGKETQQAPPPPPTEQAKPVPPPAPPPEVKPEPSAPEPPPSEPKEKAAPAKPAPGKTAAKPKSTGPDPALLNPSLASAKAPPDFRVKFETSKGDFIVGVTRASAPLGADRFYNLVKMGFYNDVAFFRVIDGFRSEERRVGKECRSVW